MDSTMPQGTPQDHGSVLDRLRAQRASQVERKRLTLEVPGWDGMLHATYQPIPWPEMYAILSTEGDDADATLNGNLDALIAACYRLEVREDPGAEPRPLAAILREQGEEVHGEVRFDETACKALGIDAGSARETVLALFQAAISPELAIAEHAARLGAWMQGVSQEVNDSLVGGS